MGLQPFLHQLIPTLMAPTQVWCDRDGQVRDAGAQGVFHGDLRALTHAVVTVDGVEPEPLSAAPAGPGRTEAVMAVRQIDGDGADPTTWLRRRTVVRPGRVEIRLQLECATAEAVDGVLELTVGSDLASLEVVKQGGRLDPVTADVVDDGGGSHSDSGPGTAILAFVGGTARVEVAARGARATAGGSGVVLRWDARAAPGTPFTAECVVTVTDSGAVVTAPARPTAEWSIPDVTASDPRLSRLLARSLDDLSTLRMTWTRAPQEVFLAAGAPWFFTLFGRDSLWAARLMLPLGTDLARGTLRTLAAAQGTAVVPATAEQPGKILHEVRPAALALGDGTVLPPVYFGTVDATALWICLLHDAWRWGMAPADVEALLPAMERALAWLRDHGDGDGDGFVDYVDETGSGLANQGWKDSGDSVQWRDGSLAEGPIALCEVQAYAYEAATGGAELLEAFGRDGAGEWRAWAGRLADRFREAFWTSDERGPYLGIAVDRHGALVDSVASNMGHVIGTGILTPTEERTIADRLVAWDMSSGLGLRTLSARMGGYWPLRYHGGAVWAHDTAIAIRGMTQAGLDDQAEVLVAGLLAAAERFDHQLPELFAGTSPDDVSGVVPYPASCHPQAWSAASSVTVLQAVLGLAPGERTGRAGAGHPRVRARGRDLVGVVSVRGLPGPHGPWSVDLRPGEAPVLR
ncbi:glycogen debranching N-terminal domain-containing protein [Serinibacter arcticus]|uniref:Amylo-alpha-1,6-glucosidase n=1 Tax=Serinibacter arcticus TaxID=1655435 RepID=A0A4Z1E5P5_9MICO|nr:glycogen debranching N-terminal domain-containing protein [Serinibacter arcticus]TGO04941.1 amylo-alpha-1,6-glucosidase [Serinibacter arcticus]